MKNKKPYLALMFGLTCYAALYVATSVRKDPTCNDATYAALAKIEDSVSTINGHIYSQVSGMLCDVIEIGFVNSNTQQYATVGDSVCAFASKLGFPLKSVVIVTVDTVLSKKDTLYTTQCL